MPCNAEGKNKNFVHQVGDQPKFFVAVFWLLIPFGVAEGEQPRE
jgi:hypothetical protein